MWGVGCIFAEMVTGKPLFPGQQNDDQLVLIWNILGTPSNENWPGVAELPEYDPDLWDPCPRVRLETELPRLERVGLALLEQCLFYSPSTRISANGAMRHAYFACLDIPIDLPPRKNAARVGSGLPGCLPCPAVEQPSVDIHKIVPLSATLRSIHSHMSERLHRERT
jgi:serine/threonine protein kinase